MCNGTIMDKLITFSVPLMLSSVLQLMFNAVDIIVVGRFSGSQALAAVGSTTALINIFVNLFIGISLGANVLAARFYALELKKEMSETVHTAITFALVSGIVVAVFGVTLARFALEIMATPEDVINKSVLYMRIYFCGMPFFMLYNYGAAVLRAVGDTKRPLLFLMISGVVNAVLNLFHKKNGSLSVHSKIVLRLSDHFLHIFLACHGCIDLRKFCTGSMRNDFCYRRLPCAGRSIENDRPQFIRPDSPIKQFILSDDVLLPHNFIQRRRPHAGCQRCFGFHGITSHIVKQVHTDVLLRIYFIIRIFFLSGKPFSP